MHKFMCVITVGFVFLLSHLEAFYCISYKRETDVPISEFSVFGERCSGTNYLQVLISTNYDLDLVWIGDKHFSPWQTLPIENYSGNPRHYTFSDTEDHLFFIIFRGPYDWVRSLRQHPWHTDESLWRIPLSQFIRSRWIPDGIHRLANLIDVDPETGCFFDNILKLRSAKIKNMLLICEKVKNCYCINYEVLRDHPEEVIAEVSSIFGLDRHPVYESVVYRKGNEEYGVYVPKKYKSIDIPDLIFINSQLDPDLEASIGYQLNSISHAKLLLRSQVQ